MTSQQIETKQKKNDKMQKKKNVKSYATITKCLVFQTKKERKKNLCPNLIRDF